MKIIKKLLYLIIIKNFNLQNIIQFLYEKQKLT